MEAAVYTITSVIIISIASLIGIFFFMLKKRTLKATMLFMVSLAVGSLFGGVFIHLLPEIIEVKGFGLPISLSVIGGILIFFIIEKFIHWRHCHEPTTKQHQHHLVPMNLIGDGVHNFLDGIIIATSYLASIEVGIATTIGVLLHEIPQEIGDFGVLLYAGLTKKKALFYNFLSALTAIIGAIIGLIIGAKTKNFALIILPITAGGFLYIAGSDLIPELHKKSEIKDTIIHLIGLFIGIGLMVILKIYI